MEVLRTLIHPSRWVEIKRSLRISIGVEVSDKQVSTALVSFEPKELRIKIPAKNYRMRSAALDSDSTEALTRG